jgi:hypothetical protein
MKNKIIDGTALCSAMKEAGLLPENCRRFVIDCNSRSIVTLYYECIGDERLLEVIRPSCMVEVKTCEPS